MMGLREAQQDVGVEKNCHLQAARRKWNPG
jgi:hypothetical protein